MAANGKSSDKQAEGPLIWVKILRDNSDLKGLGLVGGGGETLYCITVDYSSGIHKI